MSKVNKEENFILRVFKDWIIPIIAAIIIAFVINKLIFFNIVVPTKSMYPTIKPEDRILVTRIHNVNNLEVGDIVVFHSDELKEDLIKRLMGLPGDVVERKQDGSVYVNGKKIDEPYVIYDGGEAGKYTVPEGHYLFLEIIEAIHMIVESG